MYILLYLYIHTIYTISDTPQEAQTLARTRPNHQESCGRQCCESPHAKSCGYDAEATMRLLILRPYIRVARRPVFCLQPRPGKFLGCQTTLHGSAGDPAALYKLKQPKPSLTLKSFKAIFQPLLDELLLRDVQFLL